MCVHVRMLSVLTDRHNMIHMPFARSGVKDDRTIRMNLQLANTIVSLKYNSPINWLRNTCPTQPSLFLETICSTTIWMFLTPYPQSQCPTSLIERVLFAGLVVCRSSGLIFYRLGFSGPVELFIVTRMGLSKFALAYSCTFFAVILQSIIRTNMIVELRSLFLNPTS